MDSKECKVEYVDKLDLGFEVKAMVFTPEQLERPKAHIDKEWQKEIFRDNLDEIRY